MNFKHLFAGTVIGAATIFTSSAVIAGGHAAWTSVADQSSIAFGSIKKDVAGEVHHFENVVATVSEEGKVEIKIDLTSIETNIDIRNERMAEHVFKGGAEATIIGEIDMDEVKEIAPGDTGLVDIEATLMLAGLEVEIEAEMLVAPLSDSRVLVTTSDFIFVSTADLGIDDGIDMMVKLAKLPGITRTTPVSVRMVFEK
ncbi:MAG: YceI family protein [Rhizobiaceae bacterium]|nr:YceI family protein [Rhizobiaceae bacterium]